MRIATKLALLISGAGVATKKRLHAFQGNDISLCKHMFKDEQRQMWESEEAKTLYASLNHTVSSNLLQLVIVKNRTCHFIDLKYVYNCHVKQTCLLKKLCSTCM